ncbi:TlpA family protein disulfide reductase [Mucilaginibacter robiniae]|uniref:TlpA family protein disulfide reductase n=1 Tax=Mucilaginibacter robiniae TaxID=2728022 RepID=A0A7L5E011_9SPHI|nr:TlpA disulfide reductase family protein [Mucilaginibacter robiniae]QJD96710.1 TlpA family protein disulfide reductase [Mucilaginibacter robiniae]
MKRFTLITSIFLLSLYSTFAQSKLPTGIWRGALKLASGNELPFNFEVKDTAGRQQMAIINGKERFKVTDIKTKGDSVFIHMPLFDSEFRLKLQGSALSGNWIKHLGERDASTPFSAQQGVNWRFFKTPEKATYPVAGRWSSIFGENAADRDTTIGEFQQNGNKVTGTFLTTTGDYRYLEGTINGNQLYLSCFDGGHAFLFTANLKDAQTLTDGVFYSGYSGKTPWSAIKNPNAKLPDPYSLTALKPGYKKIEFSFPDAVTRKPVSLSDSRFKNKVVIMQFMGSWCPNCMDETAFLVNYYKKYHPRGVEIVGLAYERTNDFAKSQKAVLQEKSHFNIPYPLLITGATLNKQETAKSIPMLANFVAFPTTVIIDKKGDVRKIYTGYSGPGTGNYYLEFVNEFEKLTEDLLAEK